MMTHSDVDWMAVRADYEGEALSVSAIEQKYGVTHTAIYSRISSENWPRRNPGPMGERKGLIGRLYRLLERQIAQLEMDMTKPGDKEVAVLGALTRNLEKLIELDRKEAPAKPNPKRRADIDALRVKLAKRIDQLRQS